MQYPIVHVQTQDGHTLHGLLSEPTVSSKTIIIHVHGTAGSFYWSNYFKNIVSASNNLGISFLSTNNRGSGVYEIEKGSNYEGASIEKFEDSIFDIDAWINFAINHGYEKIILEGHSFGTEKCVYYMNKGKHLDKVIGVILLGFSDTIGTQDKYEKRIDKNYLSEARELVDQGMGDNLISDTFGLAGELPISASTYINFFSSSSELSKALPFRNGHNLEYLKNIQVPILGVISDKEDGEYTIIPIRDAIQLMKSENKLAEAYQIKNTDHLFTGKEEDLASIIESFIKRRILR